MTFRARHKLRHRFAAAAPVDGDQRLESASRHQGLDSLAHVAGRLRLLRPVEAEVASGVDETESVESEEDTESSDGNGDSTDKEDEE